MLRDRYLETFAERPCIWCTNLDLCITGCMLVYQAHQIKLIQHHAACAFEISHHAICVFGIPEYVLFCRLQDGATSRSTRIWF